MNQKPKSLLDNHDMQTIVHDFLRQHLSFEALPLTFQGSSDIKNHHHHINRIHVSASGNCAVNWDTPCRIHIFKLVYSGKSKVFHIKKYYTIYIFYFIFFVNNLYNIITAINFILYICSKSS